MSWIDTKYISLISNQLRNFSRRESNLFNFSCNICGDSQKNPLKARGYFYEKENKFFMKCHNCGVGMSFDNFLKKTNPHLYNQYRIEKFGNPVKKEKKEEQEFEKYFSKNILEKLHRRIIDLPQSHLARQYLEQRKIPQERLEQLYFAEDLNGLTEYFIKYKERNFPEEPRIIFPICTRQSQLVGVVCRSIVNNSQFRYINMKQSKDDPLVFNLENIDLNKKVLVTEGAFDSMFLKNAIAVNGSDLGKIKDILQKDNSILVFDNEPRHIQIIDKIERMANDGWNIVIWPERIIEKDINEMILSGIAPEEISSIIKTENYSGLRLKLKLAEWRKV